MAKTKSVHATLHLVDGQLAELRIRAISIAAGLPEAEAGVPGVMGGGYPGRPGKSADKVVADAGKIMAFVMQRK